MSGRRTRTWLQACLFLSAALLVVYAFYVNRTLSARVASAERKSTQHAKQEEQLGNQLQGVSEHRSRLERQSHRDQELINQLKKESSLLESDLKTQLQRLKDDSSVKYSQLETSHNALQKEHEKLKEEYKQMEDSYQKLTSSHSETVRQHNEKYLKLKEDKDSEVKSLFSNLNKVKADKTSALADLRRTQEELSQLNSRHTQLKVF
jgi:chromosome segregation ATPase